MAKRPQANTPPTALKVIGNDRVEIEVLFKKMTPILDKILPNGTGVQRILEVAYLAVRQTPGLSMCTQQSFVGALVHCAKLGMWPDARGMVWMIPRRTGPFDQNAGGKAWECHFQLGYQGYLELCRRSGKVGRTQAVCVYENDDFHYQRGTSDSIHHVPCRTQNRGELTAVYAVADVHGSKQFEVIEAHEIASVKAMSPGSNNQNSPWVNHAEAMWKKTALKRLAKFLPLSVDEAHAVALDDRSDADLPQGLADAIQLPEPDVPGDFSADLPPEEPEASAPAE